MPNKKITNRVIRWLDHNASCMLPFYIAVTLEHAAGEGSILDMVGFETEEEMDGAMDEMNIEYRDFDITKFIWDDEAQKWSEIIEL